MKRISKITEKQKVASGDSVEDDELDYLLHGEESLLGKRQYFSWDSSVLISPHLHYSKKDISNLNPEPTLDNQPLEPVASVDVDDSLLPDLDLDGIFDDQTAHSLPSNDQPSLLELDLLGIFEDPEPFSSCESEYLLISGLDEKAEAYPEEQEDSLEDDLLSFVSEYSDTDTSEEECEPDWLNLAGEAEEFDSEVSPAFDDVETDGGVGRTERALQAAMDVGGAFYLDESEIQIIASIFEENYWGACRVAVVRELEQGTSVTELELGSEVKNLWLEHYEFYSGQESNYRVLSWPTALKVVNSFSGYPSLEEVEQLLVYLHNHWRENRVQMLIFRSFNEYLISYLDRVIDGFEYAPEWAIEQESPLVDDFFLPPSSADIPAINDYELERAIRNVRLNSIWMN